MAFIAGEPMKTLHQLSAGALAVSVMLGLTVSSPDAIGNQHQQCVGEYTTRVRESQLFLDDGTKLRCDLFFSTPDGKTAVAKKDSIIAQQVPAFVWQFSGLLPISDWLKTVAIHSVATDQKIERWQSVQTTFYHGLRAEGAAKADAKIAFAGAYAFAPRWPYVELVEIPDEQNIPDTILYAVEVTNAARKGLSIDDYRAMSRDILENHKNISLQDIRSTVDAVDAGQSSYAESGFLVNPAAKIEDIEGIEGVDPDFEEIDLNVIDSGEEATATAGQVEAGPQEESDRDDWIVLPDGSMVLEEVGNLAERG